MRGSMGGCVGGCGREGCLGVVVIAVQGWWLLLLRGVVV